MTCPLHDGSSTSVQRIRDVLEQVSTGVELVSLLPFCSVAACVSSLVKWVCCSSSPPCHEHHHSMCMAHATSPLYRTCVANSHSSRADLPSSPLQSFSPPPTLSLPTPPLSPSLSFSHPPASLPRRSSRGQKQWQRRKRRRGCTRMPTFSGRAVVPAAPACR